MELKKGDMVITVAPCYISTGGPNGFEIPTHTIGEFDHYDAKDTEWVWVDFGDDDLWGYGVCPVLVDYIEKDDD